MDNAIVANMMSGYRYLDEIIRDERDLLAMGHSERVLEFNHRVLCGEEAATRLEFRHHIERTTHHFYEGHGGVGTLIDYVDIHRSDDVWRLAAGIYISILSEPQLFIEGNHRAGSLIMSYHLVRNGKPPFVLSVSNAKPYFDPSTLIKASKKNSVRTLIEMPKIRRRFAAFLKEQGERCYLLRA